MEDDFELEGLNIAGIFAVFISALWQTGYLFWVNAWKGVSVLDRVVTAWHPLDITFPQRSIHQADTLWDTESLL